MPLARVPGYEAVFQGHWMVFRRMVLNTGLSFHRVHRHGSLPLGSPMGLQTGQRPIR